MAAVGLATVLLLAGCARNAPQDTFQPAGENARKIDNLQRPVFYLGGLIGLFVIGIVTYIMIRYRDRGQEMPFSSALCSIAAARMRAGPMP